MVWNSELAGLVPDGNTWNSWASSDADGVKLRFCELLPHRSTWDFEVLHLMLTDSVIKPLIRKLEICGFCI